MAVSAVYAMIIRINLGGGQSEDPHIETNLSSTGTPFNLKGGRYGITAEGSTFGTLTLQILNNSGNYLPATTAFTVTGTALADLPQGTYRWSLA